MTRSNVTPMHGWCPPPCPPQTCPPPVPPDDCGCGCDQPPFGAWGMQLRDCWKQIEALKCIIKQIMDEMGGPVKTGPIQGVVDGSTALAGDVGEYVQATIGGTFPAAPNSQAISPLVLQPGDWDVDGALSVQPNTNEGFGLVQLMLSPTPTGASGNMFSYAFPNQGATSVEEWGAQIILPRIQLTCSIPTLLAFTLQTNVQAAAAAGTWSFNVNARRMR